MNVIVAFPKMENGKKIKNILVKSGYQVKAVCTTGAQTLQYADMLEEGIVVCAGRLPDMMYTQLREYLPDDFEVLVVASPNIWDGKSAEHVVYLPMPLKVHELVSTMEMISYSVLSRKKKKKTRPKERSKEEKQLIEKAKKILMERNHMTEEEAHRYIQKTSMDSGNGLAETAQMILMIQ